MRKVISILFMMCLLAVGVSAQASEINFIQNLEEGTCTVSGLLEEARSNGFVTIEVVDTKNLDDSAKIISGERISHISYIETADFLGNFTYTFKLGEEAFSGEYLLRIGAAGLSKPITKNISYVNKSETDVLILKIQKVSTGSGSEEEITAAVDEIFKLIDRKLNFLGVEDSDYTKLSTAQKKNIAREILNNRTSITTISEAANRGYQVQVLDITSIAEIDNVLEEKKSIFGIENEIMYSEYTKISDKTQFNNIFSAYTLDLAESVKKAFNESVLVYLMDNSLPGKVTELFGTYNSVIPFDLSTYNKTDKGQTAYSLAGKSITSMSVLETLINEIYTEQTAPNNGGSPGGSGGSGGSGGGFPGFISGSTASSVTGISVPADNGMFSDLGSFTWAKEAIEGLAKDGIVSGVGNRQFAPDRNITREEFVKIIVNAFGFSTDTYVGCEFDDVDKNSWAYPYISKASELGIISGISHTQFGTGKNITREDMAVMVVRAMGIAGMELTEVKDTVAFGDGEKISDYAKESVEALVGAGIINGFEDNTFRPQSAATRAQSAVMLYSVVK